MQTRRLQQAPPIAQAPQPHTHPPRDPVASAPVARGLRARDRMKRDNRSRRCEGALAPPIDQKRAAELVWSTLAHHSHVPLQPGRAAATLRRAASSAPAPHRISTRRQSNAARRTVGHIRVAGTSEAPNSPPPATRSRPGDRAVSRRGGRSVQGAPKPASGASMRNISMVRSGSTSAWLRNART